MLMKEYRICMPLTVEEYRIGQLYMISKHCCEESGGGEGVEVVKNEPDVHPQHGPGQVTEKRIYLSSKLPQWLKTFVPPFFYVTEKAWNFYPYTITEYSISFLTRFSIRIETRFENNNGSNNNILQKSTETNVFKSDLAKKSVTHVINNDLKQVFGDTPTPAENVSFLDILSDPIPEKHKTESEDLSRWRSSKANRGPLKEGWRDHHNPTMCSYKRVQCSFEVFGFQTKVEALAHEKIKEILLVAHRQAVAWLDEWHGLSLEEVRDYEEKMQEKTNSKVKSTQIDAGSQVPSRPAISRSVSVTDERSLKKMGVTTVDMTDTPNLTVPRGPIRLNSTPE